jgi:glycosyltransferase involved in cell wall biosynthesis
VKIGFHSPLPPARTGVAEYSFALKKALEATDTIEVNSANADLDLYHIGNNQLHAAIYQRALSKPGVVVLHDAVLQHFFLGSLDQDSYITEFTFNYGEWSRDFAQSLWRDRAGSGADPRYFQYPMLKRIAANSRAVIVHNPAAAALVQAHSAATAIHQIPHLFDPPAPVPPYEVESLRRDLGVKPGAFLLGVFGHLRESKRLATVLRAVRKVPHLQLLVCGEFASTDLARALAPELKDVIRVGYLPDDSNWWRHAAAVDACVNLRFPAAGETSGIAIRLMGIGKPVILSSGLETKDFPPEACIRIETGIAEEDMLVDILLWLSRHPNDAQEIGARAKQHIAEVHALAVVAALYRKCLMDCYY